MPKDTPKISLSADTWVKIVLFLFAHAAVIVAAAWQMSTQYENRFTVLETNQKIILRIVEAKHIND